MDSRYLTRRELLVLLGGATVTIAACGGDSSPSNPAGPSNPTSGGTGSGDKAGQISANHGHSAVITSAQLQAGGGLTLDIRGGATHPHTVTLTANQVASIRGGGSVTVTSTMEDGHDHAVTFN